MYDVIIVGACTAGTYFADLLAKRGLNVLVMDKDSEANLAKRLDIIHFTRDSYEEFGVAPSGEGDEEFCEYTILKEIVGEDGEAEWVSIDDDDEFDDVADYFDDLFSKEIDYDAGN